MLLSSFILPSIPLAESQQMNNISTILTLDPIPSEVTEGDIITITGNLETTSGQGLDLAPVKILIIELGTGYIIFDFFIDTDSTGRFTHDLSGLGLGTWSIQAHYDISNYKYNTSTSSIITFTVIEPAPEFEPSPEPEQSPNLRGAEPIPEPESTEEPTIEPEPAPSQEAEPSPEPSSDPESAEAPTETTSGVTLSTNQLIAISVVILITFGLLVFQVWAIKFYEKFDFILHTKENYG